MQFSEERKPDLETGKTAKVFLPGNRLWKLASQLYPLNCARLELVLLIRRQNRIRALISVCGTHLYPIILKMSAFTPQHPLGNEGNLKTHSLDFRGYVAVIACCLASIFYSSTLLVLPAVRVLQGSPLI